MSPSQMILDVDELEPTAAYAHAILTALANTLTTKVSKPHPDSDIPKYINTLLPHLFRLCLEAAVATDKRVLADIRLLGVAARIVRLVLEASPAEYAVHTLFCHASTLINRYLRSQSKFLGAMTDAYLNGQVRSVTGGEFTSAEVFKPMDVRYIILLLENRLLKRLIARSKRSAAKYNTSLRCCPHSYKKRCTPNFTVIS